MIAQWPLPLDTEMTDYTFDSEVYPDLMECDWEEDLCPVCGHDLDRHSNRVLQRCASATL
jgi:hypothetical protein